MYNLASIGVGRIIGFDHDEVELSNLNRQILYSEQDIGRPKALAARERLQSFNTNVSIETYPIAITKENLERHIPSDANVIISTVFPLEYHLNPFCVRHKIPLLAQGGGGYSPSGVIVMIPYKTGCFDCVEDPTPVWNELLHKVRSRHGGTYVSTTTFSPIVSLCANIMAIEIFKLVTWVADLDLCCGTGRHSIELAQRGFEVIGLDISETFLQIAQRKAAAKAISVRWLCRDMREIPYEDYLNLIINLYGSWGYFEDDGDNFRVLY